jgi:hypothetical protein
MTSMLLAFAHPGHGDTDPDSWTHYLTEPVHVAVLVAALAVTFFVIRAWRSARQRDR